MAKEILMQFKHDNKSIKVFTGESSLDVFYNINGGSNKDARMKYNPSTGTFNASGSSLTFEKAKGYIRNKL